MEAAMLALPLTLRVGYVTLNYSFTLLETDSGTDWDSDSCPVQK